MINRKIIGIAIVAIVLAVIMMAYTRSNPIVRLFAALGYVPAESKVDVAYDRDCSQDASRSLARYPKAIDKEYPKAQKQHGMKHEIGSGVPKKDFQAVDWTQKAVEQIYPPAQICLGGECLSGTGASEDPGESIYRDSTAAEQGSDEAVLGLDNLYFNDHGVIENDAEAVMWFRNAADGYNPRAWVASGLAYEAGQGTSRNINEAIVWYRKAVAIDNSSSCDNNPTLLDCDAILIAKKRLSNLESSTNNTEKKKLEDK